jgi:hypothetical protein
VELYDTDCITVREVWSSKCSLKSCKGFMLLLYEPNWKRDCRNNAGCIKINRDQFRRYEYSSTVITESNGMERGRSVHCHCISGVRFTPVAPPPGALVCILIPPSIQTKQTDWNRPRPLIQHTIELLQSLYCRHTRCNFNIRVPYSGIWCIIG